MIPLPPDFKKFLKLLGKYEVKYLIVGGYAVAYHGYIRATNDIDIWISNDTENAKYITEAIREFGFDVPELSSELFLKEKQVIRMGNPPLRIEIITTASGISFNECYNSRLKEKINDITVNILSLEKLKINKKESGRLKDLNDLENLP